MGLGGFFKGLGKAGLGFLTGGPMGAISAGLGAIAEGKAHNRGEKLSGQMDLARLLMDREADFQGQSIAREQEGRAGGMDAFRRLLMAQRTLNPGARPQLSPYSVAPRVAGMDERAGAEGMSREVLARLLGGNPLEAVKRTELGVDPKLLNPGKLEQILGYAAPILSGAGAVASSMRK
jgi:hypothetical protein